MNIRLFFSFMILSFMSTPAFALNILISNDDGLTSNVRALYEALKAEGHDVIVSVPCVDQSGMGAALRFRIPLAPLASGCRNEAAHIGDPGAGPMTRTGFSPDYHYVDGAPVMATLYGIDVLAARRWGGNPDLVLSGPNEGQNAGPVILISDTVSNAQIAALRGIPAIALSGGMDTADDDELANPKSWQIAGLAVKLVQRLERGASNGRLLPKGMALNVNFPDDLSEAAWQASRIGDYSASSLRFVDDLSQDSIAKPVPDRDNGLPGVAVLSNMAPPSKDQMRDEAVIYRTKIAISVMRAGYEDNNISQNWLNDIVSGL